MKFFRTPTPAEYRAKCVETAQLELARAELHLQHYKSLVEYHKAVIRQFSKEPAK